MSETRRKRRELQRRVEKTRRKLFASRRISKRCADLSDVIDAGWEGALRSEDQNTRLFAAAMTAVAERLRGISRLMAFDDNVNSDIIARSLYDHVVTLAWLAVDPDQNREAFVAGVEKSELVAAEELRGFDFQLLGHLDDDFLRNEKACRSALPNLKERARLADARWRDELRLATGLDFSAFYSHFYRMLSRSREHAGSAVLKTASGSERGPEATRNFWLGIVPALVYYAILIANHIEARVDPVVARDAVDYPTDAAREHGITT